MNIKELLKKLDIDNGDIAEMFGYKSRGSYANCKKAKPRLEKGLLKFYELIEHRRSTGFKVTKCPECLQSCPITPIHGEYPQKIVKNN